tara:strand:+ start:46468 stop:49431 length:2964 start_codon:yes stop_codon:yes gene_type:complete
VILSGASVREANAAMIQLSQGMASGRLNGEELRSVLEQLPYVADVIGQELVRIGEISRGSLGEDAVINAQTLTEAMINTRGEMRALGADGKITSQVIIDAFRNAGVEIDSAFAQTQSTIGQAISVLRTNLLSTLDSFDDATQFSASLADAIRAVSDSLDVLLPLLAAYGVSVAARFSGNILRSTINATRQELAYQAAVRNGSAIVLGSVQANEAKAAAVLAESRAKAGLEAQTVRYLTTQKAEIAAQLQALRADQASIAIDRSKQTAVSTLTGRTIEYDTAVRRNLQTTQAINIAEQNLVSTKRALIAAMGAQRNAAITLAADQSRAAAATAAANTFGQRLIRIVPGLSLVAAGLRTIVSLLGGPVSAAFIAVIGIMAVWRSRSEVIEASTRRLESIANDVREAYAGVNGEVGNIADKLSTITRVEAMRELTNQTNILKSSQSALAAELQNVGASYVALGDQYFVEQFRNMAEEVRNGTANLDQLRNRLSGIAETSPFEEIIVGAIEASRETSTAEENFRLAEAILAVLDGTATGAQRALLGLSSGADTAAGSVRNLGSAALASINALRQLKGFIPELDKAARMQEDLAEAQNLYTIGVNQAQERLDSGVGSLDQYAATVAELEETYKRARAEIDGTAESQREANKVFEEYSNDTNLQLMDDRARAIQLEKDSYNEVREAIEGTAGATERLAALESQHSQRLQQINKDFDEMEAKAGGGGKKGASAAAKKLKEELKEVNSVLESIKGPADNYNRTLEILDELLEKGKISQAEFNTATRDSRIAFLESQTTMQAGFESGFLKIIQKTEDAASQMENIITSAFDGMSKSIADLVVDGEADFSSLIKSINKMIIQLVVSQAFQQLFGDQAGVNGGGLFSSFSSALGGIVDSAFAGLSGAPGAAAGGSFTVGAGQGFGGLRGHDDRLVPLRLKTGEHVDITPRGQEPNRGGGETHVHNWNITTPNAESFQASRSQVSARAARAVSIGRRNM